MTLIRRHQARYPQASARGGPLPPLIAYACTSACASNPRRPLRRVISHHGVQRISTPRFEMQRSHVKERRVALSLATSHFTVKPLSVPRSRPSKAQRRALIGAAAISCSRDRAWSPRQMCARGALVRKATHRSKSSGNSAATIQTVQTA